jgi:hypothetical protein
MAWAAVLVEEDDGFGAGAAGRTGSVRQGVQSEQSQAADCKDTAAVEYVFQMQVRHGLPRRWQESSIGGGELARWAIRGSRRTQLARGHGNHRHGSAGHVEKLNAATCLFARDSMALDQGTDVPIAQSVLWQVNGQNHVEVHRVTPDTL